MARELSERGKSARLLLDAGADVDARRDEENGTPLSGALCTENIEVIKVLLENDANVNAECGWQAGTVVEQADQICENLSRVHDEKIQTISKLLSEASGRPVPQRTPAGNVIPLLFVKDFKKSLEFYTDKLGFRLEWLIENDSTDPYGSIVRGSANFHITVCKCDDTIHVGKLWTRLQAVSVDALHDELVAKGVEPLYAPKDQPWGLREFELFDDGGNRFEFFEFPQ